MFITLTCKHCGNPFTRNVGKRTQSYCSPDCGFSARKERTDKKYIGQRFGKLTVVERVRKSTESEFTCLCDCGNKTVVRIGHLADGNILSCGCHRSMVGKQMSVVNFSNMVNISPGTRFGRLVIIGENGRKYNGLAYDCLCDCGGLVNVGGKSLLSGKTKSCGCYHKDVSAETLRKAATTHGLSKEPWYKRWTKHIRRKADRGWTLDMEQMLYRLQPVCVICGSDDRLAIDHVRPLSKGGKLEPGNVVILCKSCNSTKKNKTPEEMPVTKRSIIDIQAKNFKRAWDNRNS